MDLLQKIEELKAKYNDPIDAPQLTAWEKEATRLLLIEGVAGSDAVKYLTNQLRSEIETMDSFLLTMPSNDLPDILRDRMLDKKALYLRVISYFDVDTAKKELEKRLDAN